MQLTGMHAPPPSTQEQLAIPGYPSASPAMAEPARGDVRVQLTSMHAPPSSVQLSSTHAPASSVQLTSMHAPPSSRPDVMAVPGYTTALQQPIVGSQALQPMLAQGSTALGHVPGSQ